MIEFHSVSKRYPGGLEGLREVTTHIGRGEMVFLTGHSGAGKSTMLRLVSLLETASSGNIVVAGTNLARLARSRIPYLRRRIGFVFQDHRLLLDRTVFDNVALPLVVAGHGHVEIGRRVRAALDKVGLLERERHHPTMLSAGEQQRVGIARAVVARPPILLADEPTGNLDPELSLEIMRLFARFNDVGVTLLIATHDLDLLDHLGHRRIQLEGGRLTRDSKK